ncbi:helix-turn-helix domain-containing protein [Listeria booriae]|uniref:Helix-turn-helix domain-containing protein n=1 Tax=Listeria booriae TaxID=1552123 RepID=A0A7X0XYM9_9LIST|nr:helix-turn-helix domain-containing protein [Listeria booriae]MBC1554069.1 helix-turn-helix domain-containing protein [Listeria booriae]MBC1565651.1 helix-turn-helix domain-containing protein [Listeria booriae]MBC1793997.1 helix-turn-helix domain-containing protein [Listeria booriae]MBC1795856.1 helix-turn-helix domain-containing protein [Listeria booriae]MBC1813658.1 helix-turn-helix domain-containing protein [Listeria booriae]
MENEQLLEILDAYFLSTREAIDTLEVSKQSFYSLVTRNKITKIQKGSCILYYRHQIEERKSMQHNLREKYRPYNSQ